MTLPNNQNKLTAAALLHTEKLLEGMPERLAWKTIHMSRYFEQAGIKKVVLGVSGGIDSAVVLGLLARCRVDVDAYTINFGLYKDIFEQKYVDDLAKAFYRFDPIYFKTIDATKGFNALLETMFEDTSAVSDQVRAQASYALRYQMLFTYAQQSRNMAVTCGTTNRDEFEYAGWFGKNSDMVVDIQVITDWSKCQVIQAAKWLDVPQSIIDRAPVGDLLDMSTDEENFGCTYDELAYFQDCVVNSGEINAFLQKKFKKLCDLHKRNAHKYQGQTYNPFFIK